MFQLLKKDVPFIWSEDYTVAFEELKNKLVSVPILTPSDYKKPFIICMDASRTGLSGVFLQVKDNIEVPIYFESRSLSPSENNYSVTDWEGKAVFHCVRKFKFFLTGSPFVITPYTDHKPLVSIFANKKTVMLCDPITGEIADRNIHLKKKHSSVLY